MSAKKFPLCEIVSCIEPSPFRPHEYMVTNTKFVISKDWKKSPSPLKGFQVWCRSDWTEKNLQMSDLKISTLSNLDDIPDNVRASITKSNGVGCGIRKGDLTEITWHIDGERAGSFSETTGEAWIKTPVEDFWDEIPELYKEELAFHLELFISE